MIGEDYRTRVVFDGHDLTDGFMVYEVERPYPGTELTTQTVGSMDGTFVTGGKYGPLQISMTLVCDEQSRVKRHERMRELMAWLDVDGPRRLSFSDDLGMWYEAIPTGERERTGYFHSEAVRVSFLVPSPALWGETRGAVVPSGGSVTVRVGGTYPARAVVVSEAALGDSTGLWGLALDSVEHLHVPVSHSASQAVTADFDDRSVTVGASSVLPTLDSDWWELSPGVHEITMDRGTGAASVQWVERWL